ncbi:sister chromatid cohesion protein PDS5 [Methanobrevibacter sp.]|uniref:sister chromatid cohesion protein PDS5 n=1 Tax=Methanobrevibacter sp. TaxID=66852 RepID=UPI0025F8A760|nr:sister chromatid cohesion protein PDS5 [Methanobrevibacter sp.]
MISEKELLEELRQIQKSNENWKNHIDDVAAKLDENYSVNVKAKALWILGEMGLKYPQQVKPYINQIAGYMDDDNPKLRERSINALGRIGRADKNLVTPYLDKLMNMRNDDMGNVRLAFVWACENIATNSPELFCEKMDIFCDLIDDSNEKVRIEAPEMFRVVGKRKPMYVKPYLNKLQSVAENNEHPVVRIHCEGAIRITNNALDKNNDL